MPHFAANLTFLFTEMPFMERFDAAKRAGFDAVEFMFPYDYNQDEIREQLTKTGLQLVLCNLPAGNWAGGDRGTAAIPERKREFREGVAKGIEAARTLGFSRMNCLVGLIQEDLSAGETRNILVENIRYAAEALNEAGIRLMVEPVNRLDMPGFALNSCAQVLDTARGDRPSQRLPAVRRLPRPARERGRGGDPPRPFRPDRPHPDRRLPGPPPARHGGNGFQVPPFGNRSHEISGICLTGVCPGPRHPELSSMAACVRIPPVTRTVNTPSAG